VPTADQTAIFEQALPYERRRFPRAEDVDIRIFPTHIVALYAHHGHHRK
jgi:hypothetical protein